MEDSSLTVQPQARMSRHVDAYGNEVRWFQVAQPHGELTIDAQAVVTSEVPPPLLHSLFPSEQWGTLAHPEFRDLHADFLAPSTYVRPAREVDELAEELGVPQERGVDRWVLDLADAVSAAIVYQRGATAVDTPVEDVARHRRGVCQDLAHLTIALCRMSMANRTSRVAATTPPVLRPPDLPSRGQLISRGVAVQNPK